MRGLLSAPPLEEFCVKEFINEYHVFTRGCLTPCAQSFSSHGLAVGRCYRYSSYRRLLKGVPIEEIKC